jgi:hypothetical protein
VEFVGLDGVIGAVSLNGAALSELADLSALESSAAPGWVEEAGHVWVRLPAAGGEVVFER